MTLTTIAWIAAAALIGGLIIGVADKDSKARTPFTLIEFAAVVALIVKILV